jgi:hypothetical protein
MFLGRKCYESFQTNSQLLLETASQSTYPDAMKEQSLTLRLPGSVLQWIERSSGDKAPTDYIVEVLEGRMKQVLQEDEERKRWLALGRKQYTEDVCRQTLDINDQFPIHEE